MSVMVFSIYISESSYPLFNLFCTLIGSCILPSVLHHPCLRLRCSAICQNIWDIGHLRYWCLLETQKYHVFFPLFFVFNRKGALELIFSRLKGFYIIFMYCSFEKYENLQIEDFRALIMTMKWLHIHAIQQIKEVTNWPPFPGLHCRIKTYLIHQNIIVWRNSYPSTHPLPLLCSGHSSFLPHSPPPIPLYL